MRCSQLCPSTEKDAFKAQLVGWKYWSPVRGKGSDLFLKAPKMRPGHILGAFKNKSGEFESEGCVCTWADCVQRSALMTLSPLL